MVVAFLLGKDSVNVDCFDYRSEERAENQTPDYISNSFAKCTSTLLSILGEVWYQKTSLGCMPLRGDVPTERDLVGLL